MGRKPKGMPESEYRAYLKRQGQETPPEIEQFLPDEPPVLTEEEKMFCATGDEREAWARERSQAFRDSLPLQPGEGYAALAEAKAVLDEYRRRRRSEGI